MNVIEAIKKRRTVRIFEQREVSRKDIMTLIDCARYAATGGNKQPLKFAVLDNAKEVYPLTLWAAYLKDWEPAEDQRPPVYIAVLGDNSIKQSFETEAGAAVTSMMLAAEELGLATCWLGAIDRAALRDMLGTEHSVLYLLAVGYPAQKCIAEDICDNDVKYYPDSEGVIHVPKRTIDEVLI